MKAALPLLFLLLLSDVPHLASQTTTYTFGPSSTSNGNHLVNCPSQMTSVDGQATSPPDGGICFLASSSGGDYLNPSSPYCAGPNNSFGQCFSAYLYLNGLGGNYYQDGCVYNSATAACESLPFPITTYCAPPTAPYQTNGCGLGSTYAVTFGYWFPSQQAPNPLSSDSNAWTGSITVNLQTNNFFRICPYRRPCYWVANNVVTGGNGTVMPLD